MDQKRQSRLAPAIIAAAVLLPIVVLTVYVAGYFWLPETNTYFVAEAGVTWSESHFAGSSKRVKRLYDHYWQVRIYRPAAAIESRLRGIVVRIDAESNPSPNGP
jgi:hypothetical protein